MVSRIEQRADLIRLLHLLHCPVTGGEMDYQVTFLKVQYGLGGLNVPRQWAGI